jgi:hypothetical protein
MGPRFFLRTLPTMIVMATGTAAGFLVGRREGAGTAVPAVVVALLCLVGAWTFRTERWAPVVLVGFSASAGVLVARLPALADPSAVRWPMVVSCAGLTGGALVGRILIRGLQKAYLPMWIVAWLVVLAAAALSLTGSPIEWAPIAAKVLLAIFLALAAAWFARLGQEPSPTAALDLYLIGLNLFLAASVLLSPTA